MLLVVGACLDDKTNYDYKDINNFDDQKWKINKIESRYSLYPGESVTITPEVKFSIDTLNPDIDCSWLLDGVEVGTASSYTFNAEEYGNYNLVFLAIDKKTGVAFPAETSIEVAPIYKLGWLILSRKASGETRLSMLAGRNQPIAYKTPEGYNRSRDSMVYTGFYTNLGEFLGSEPIKLIEEYTYPASNLLEESEIMVLEKNGTVELGGTALTFTGRPIDEFATGAPVNFRIKDAALGWCGKWLQTDDNQLYFSIGKVATDLHSGRYNSDAAFGGAKYHTLVPIMKASDYPPNVFLAIDETNTMWAISDYARPNYSTSIIDPLNYAGTRSRLVNNSQGSFDMSLFNNFTGNYIQHLFVPSTRYFLSLLERDGKYIWHKYVVEVPYPYKDNEEIAVKASTTGQFASSTMFANFKDAVFVDDGYDDLRWLFVASGNKIYGSVMDWEPEEGKMQTSKDFYKASSDIVSIKGRYFSSSLDGYIHLGVLLADGTFQVLEVNYDSDIENFTTKIIYNENLKILDPEISDVVDMIHKYGDSGNLQYGAI
jgi:hypothetical protein